MEEIIIPSDLTINIADAELLEIMFSSEGLMLKYLDWQRNKHIISFNYVLAYRFEQISDVKHRTDKVYEVINSNYLREQLRLYQSNNPYDEIEKFRHIRFCFNSTDNWLEVLTDGNITLEQE